MFMKPSRPTEREDRVNKETRIKLRMDGRIEQCSRYLLICLIIIHCLNEVAGSLQQVPAMFVFGDSLVDCGNNNYLSSIAKANYRPYGIDFFQGPTGRFCNGKTIIDFLGGLLGLPYLPASEDAKKVESMINGVNYASAAGGILEQTGQFLGDRFAFGQQVTNFNITLNRLKNQMSETDLTQYLAKSIVMVVMGNNDYINNYLLPTLYPTIYYYTPENYADLLIHRYNDYIMALYNSGLRKFLLAGVGPLGCIPNQLAVGITAPGNCVTYTNEIVGLFNIRLRTLVECLNTNHPGAIFVYGNTYGALGDLLNNPSMYGFTVTNTGCCGVGRNRGQITCLPLEVPCTNRNEYVFWDAFHPTEAVNAILAKRAYVGPPSDCYPINVQQMTQL